MAVQIPAYSGSVPNRQTDTKEEFAQNIYDMFVWTSDSFTPNFNQASLIVNDNAIKAYNNAIDAKKSADSAENNRVLCLAYSNDALSARDEIKGYVIPTDATYDPQTIDAKIQTSKLENFLGFNF